MKMPIQFLFNLLMYTLWFNYYEHMLVPRWKRTRRILCFTLIFVIPMVLIGQTELLPSGFYTLRFLFGLMSTAIYVIVTYQDSISKKGFIYTSQYLIMTIGEVGAFATAAALGDRATSIDAMTVTTFSISVAIDVVIQAVLYLTVILFWKKQQYCLQTGALPKLMFYPISQLALLIGTVWILVGHTKAPLFICIIFFLATCVGSSITLLHAIKEIGRLREAEAKNNMLEEQKNLQMRHYEKLQQQYSDVWKLKHDIANHLRTIQVLTERGDEVAARLYAKEVQKCYEQIELDISEVKSNPHATL